MIRHSSRAGGSRYGQRQAANDRGGRRPGLLGAGAGKASGQSVVPGGHGRRVAADARLAASARTPGTAWAGLDPGPCQRSRQPAPLELRHRGRAGRSGGLPARGLPLAHHAGPLGARARTPGTSRRERDARWWRGRVPPALAVRRPRTRSRGVRRTRAAHGRCRPAASARRVGVCPRQRRACTVRAATGWARAAVASRLARPPPACTAVRPADPCGLRRPPERGGAVRDGAPVVRRGCPAASAGACPAARSAARLGCRLQRLVLVRAGRRRPRDADHRHGRHPRGSADRGG